MYMYFKLVCSLTLTPDMTMATVSVAPLVDEAIEIIVADVTAVRAQNQTTTIVQTGSRPVVIETTATRMMIITVARRNDQIRTVVDVPAHQSIAVAGIVDDIVTPAHGHGHGPVSVTTGTTAVTSPIVIRRKTEKIRKRNVTRVHLRMGPVMKENRRNHHLMY